MHQAPRGTVMMPWKRMTLVAPGGGGVDDGLGAIRAAIAERKRCEGELAEARAAEQRVLAQLDLLAPAEAALAAAQEADAADRKARARRGQPGSDPALVAAVRAARDAVADATAAAEAAQAVKREWAARCYEAQLALESAASTVDQVVWDHHMAAVVAETESVREALKIVQAFAERIAVLENLGKYGKWSGIGAQSVPSELLELVPWKPDLRDAELEARGKTEVAALRALRAAAEKHV